MFAVRRSTPEDVVPCVAIVRGLSDYFTENIPEQVARDLASHDGWVIAEGNDVAGFAVVDRRSPGSVEILHAAVRREMRSLGHGGLLIEHILDGLAAEGVELAEVKTQDRSADYPPYEATRAFWQRHRFVYLTPSTHSRARVRATRQRFTFAGCGLHLDRNLCGARRVAR